MSTSQKKRLASKERGAADPHEFDNLGKHLFTVRIRRGLTQQQLAARSGIDQSTISRIELLGRQPSLEQLTRLARALNVSLQWFLTGSDWPGTDLADIAVELRNLGMVDLWVKEAALPGAFRPREQVVALALRGDQPEPRIVEAIPAVLAWNRLNHDLLQAYGNLDDPRVRYRIAWLAEVALTIHKNFGFPGGCPESHSLALFVKQTPLPTEEDSLGHRANDGTPPVWKRWKITYAADLATFRKRAEQLKSLREEQGGRQGKEGSKRHG